MVGHGLSTVSSIVHVLCQAIDSFQKWGYVMWFHEREDKHQNKAYVSEERFESFLEVFA